MPPFNPQLAQQTQPPNRRPSNWGGYVVLVLLLSAGGAGIILGVRPVSPPQVATATTTTPTSTATYNDPPRSTATASSDRANALVIADTIIGKGATAQAGDKVKVHYVGTLNDGKEFDSSRKHGQPFEFDLGKGRVIKGWDTGVAGMKVGGKRTLIIPPHLGYGARGAGASIPPNATLTFEVELLGVQRDGTPALPSPKIDGDPNKGVYTLHDATDDLPGTGRLMADIDTSHGKLTCQLYSDKAPQTVANFIGLSTGKRIWKDPTTFEWVNRPAYDGTSFHRIIKGFIIQGGDPKGNGTGEPGFTFPDEKWQGASHDRAGLLCMANRGANTNGAQFFIMDAAATHIDNSYTIFGECEPLTTIHEIAAVPTTGDRPVTKEPINHVSIYRNPS